MKKTLIVCSILCGIMIAQQVSATGFVIVPTSGPGYASGKPCSIITFADDGSSYTEEGVFNDELKCEVTYDGVVTSEENDLSPWTELLDSFVYNIRAAIRQGTIIFN